MGEKLIILATFQLFLDLTYDRWEDSMTDENMTDDSFGKHWRQVIIFSRKVREKLIILATFKLMFFNDCIIKRIIEGKYVRQ